MTCPKRMLASHFLNTWFLVPHAYVGSTRRVMSTRHNPPPPPHAILPLLTLSLSLVLVGLPFSAPSAYAVRTSPPNVIDTLRLLKVEKEVKV